MGQRRRIRHNPEQIVKKLRDADAMLNAGKDLAAVLQALEVSEATYHRWRNQFVGIDWGTDQNYVCFLSADQSLQRQRTFENNTAGVEVMIGGISSQAGGERESVAVAIERPNGAIVETLLAHELAVYAINPKQLDRFRDRHCVAGSKDDRRDAFVLADSLRTDLFLFTCVALDEPQLVELRECVRLDH